MDYLSKYIGSKTTLNSKKWGVLEFESISISPAIDGDLVVKIGNPEQVESPLVRIHSECIFAEIFDSDFCDCAEQFELAMQAIKNDGNGFLFYLRLDGRGAGLAAKVKATNLEIQGKDTFESRIEIGVKPECREYNKIGKFLKLKGIDSIRLLTNNPDKIKAIESSKIKVIPVSLVIENPNENVKSLYKTKKNKFNHNIPNNYINNEGYN